MLSQYKRPLVSISILVLVASTSYAYFQTYQPKALKRLEEVKGFKTDRVTDIDLNLPVPADAKELGRNKGTEDLQVTFLVTNTSENIQTFYKNILMSKEWKIEVQMRTDATIKTKYRSVQDNKHVTITTSSQDSQTILSIETF